MLIIATVLALFAFSLYHPIDSFHGDIANVDAFINASCECFFHILCKLNKPMEVKKIIDEYHPETLHVIDDGLKGMVSASIIEEVDYNYDNLVSDEYWEKNIYNIICKVLTDDDRGKMSAYYGGPMIDHFTKACGDDAKVEVCSSLNKGAVVYYEMVERYKTECMKATPDYLNAHTFEGMVPQFGK